MTPVQSSNVATIGRDGEDLIVEFTNGKIYRYIGAGELEVAAISADSVGRFLNQAVKGVYDYEQEA